MHHKNLLTSGAAAAVTGLILAAAPTALAAGSLPKVSVRVEGKTKTLLAATTVQATSKAVSQGGHSCAGDSGAGAFNVATKGKWSGSWSASLADFEVTKILGETDNYSTTKSYWEVFVNNVAASTGICGIKLKAGEQLLFAAVGNTESPALPLGITVSGTTAKVVYYTAKGKAKPLAGVTVKGGTATTKTNSAGKATLPAYGKPTTVTASKTGYIRAEATVD
jgi:hypothetical protein